VPRKAQGKLTVVVALPDKAAAGADRAAKARRARSACILASVDDKGIMRLTAE
jgi:hypothetical protein